MGFLSFWIGASIAYAFAYWVIQNHRIKRGLDNPTGSAIWAIWVTEALYGAGSREDWRADEALSYIVLGFAWWAVQRYRRRRPA